MARGLREHRCPECGSPTCSLPDPATLGVPNWILALGVLVAATIAMIAYTVVSR
ncbi:hypothetical protein [Streptomyces sp. NPDC003077]|uniref:hypothetical protein n=1 Tax=Streptomyces sp. NPDC003077 TaxID=3154443 RepID=UPI0033B2F520